MKLGTLLAESKLTETNFQIQSSAIIESYRDLGIHAYVTCPQGGTIEILNLKDSKMEEPIRLTKGVDGMAWVSSATN